MTIKDFFAVAQNIDPQDCYIYVQKDGKWELTSYCFDVLEQYGDREIENMIFDYADICEYISVDFYVNGEEDLRFKP